LAINDLKIGRRRLLYSTLALGAAYGLGLGSRDILRYTNRSPYERATAAVLPEDSVATRFTFGGAIARLVAGGAVVPEKMAAVYRQRGGLPDWVVNALKGQGSGEIELSQANMPYLLNLLWPLGIANLAAFKDRNPIPWETLPRLASTGGWNLGVDSNGASYYNGIAAVPLTAEQDAMVERMAAAIYRPCCDNATLFPDCNHGAAMLGFLELTAAQGLPEARIWQLAKVLNGFWYPKQYVAMALLFDLRDNSDWEQVSPQTLLGKDYSSISGWRANVDAQLSVLTQPGAIPTEAGGGGGSGCAI
jgi:hypothetical protein